MLSLFFIARQKTVTRHNLLPLTSVVFILIGGSWPDIGGGGGGGGGEPKNYVGITNNTNIQRINNLINV